MNKIINTIIEVVESLPLAALSVIASPIRSLINIDKAIDYVYVLAPKGLLFNYLISDLRYSLRRYESSARLLNSILIILKDEYKNDNINWLIYEMYCQLYRCYQKDSDVENMAKTVVNAYESLGVQSLIDANSMNIKAAHIVIAGFSSARFIDGYDMVSVKIVCHNKKDNIKTNLKIIK